MAKNATLGDSADSGNKLVQSFHLKTIGGNNTRQLRPDIGAARGRHDTQINDIEHNDTQHNETPHNETPHNDTAHNDAQHYGFICDTQ